MRLLSARVIVGTEAWYIERVMGFSAVSRAPRIPDSLLAALLHHLAEHPFGLACATVHRLVVHPAQDRLPVVLEIGSAVCRPRALREAQAHRPHSGRELAPGKFRRRIRRLA